MVRSVPDVVQDTRCDRPAAGFAPGARAARDARGAEAARASAALRTRRLSCASARKRGCRRTRAAGLPLASRTSNLSWTSATASDCRLLRPPADSHVGERLAAAAPDQAARKMRLALGVDAAGSAAPRPAPSARGSRSACRADQRCSGLAFDAVDREAPVPAGSDGRGVRAAGVRRRSRPGARPSSQRSKRAMLSTCAVCGNMLTTPAAASRNPLVCTRMPASRASVAGSQET